MRASPVPYLLHVCGSVGCNSRKLLQPSLVEGSISTRTSNGKEYEAHREGEDTGLHNHEKLLKPRNVG